MVDTGLFMFLVFAPHLCSSRLHLNLAPSHIPYHFYNNPHLHRECSEDLTCPYKHIIEQEGLEKCWGYEKKCTNKSNFYSYPSCPGSAKGWVKTKEEHQSVFWKQGDFGYVREKIEDMITLCKARSQLESSLHCVKNMVYCHATNIYMDFTKLKSKDHVGKLDERYREDVFSKGQLGGNCDLKESLLKKQGERKSPLQSWYSELQAYSHIPQTRMDECDVTLDKPTVFMKLDAGVNLFHHYCDFINLYASQHINNSFDQDITIVMWDTSNMDYFDICSETWRVFSHHPVIHLREFDGKKVCIKDALFPLLARMRFGLYYNMPLISGCSGTGLFKAFNHHLIHRLNITQHGPLANQVRVTLLVRSTQYRKILNQDELIKAMKTRSDIHLTVVDYKYRLIPFLEQVNITHNSDIFIGMHGAGLTHVLFQPDWAVLFELYNCDDKDCYHDLSRLRGAKYITWQKKEKLQQEDEGHHPTLGAHKKFTNYGFDVTEFMRLLVEGIIHVTSHPAYIRQRQEREAREADWDHTEL